jgi:hypothetical protein
VAGLDERRGKPVVGPRDGAENQNRQVSGLDRAYFTASRVRKRPEASGSDSTSRSDALP